jgi:hypothetical protein
MAGFSMDDYIDVAERVQNFKDEFPDGSLQRLEWELKQVGNQVFVVYTAAAYRTPDDPRPGMGTAWEPFPGTTPYTRNSELMNAETAAWGRAIVALGLTSNRKLASRQEVRARREEQQQVPQPPKSDVTEAMPWDPPTLAHAVSNGDVPSEPAEDDPMPAEHDPMPAEHDPMPAEHLLSEMKRQRMNVGQVRELLLAEKITPPDDMRSVEARRAFLHGLHEGERITIANALVERAKLEMAA